MGEEEKSFVRYRFERAKEELEISKLLCSKKFYKTANSRAYYAIFYAIRAVLAPERKDLINTDTAREIAIERHKFLENFLKEFLDEWNGVK